MKPTASPLNIIDFALISLEFNFVQPSEKGEVDVRRLFANYSLDVDFSIHSNEVIQVFIKAEINRGPKKLPGYSVSAEAACIFEFNNEIKIPEEAKNSIEGYSTIYIALNALRGFIGSITSNAPMGRYVLPSVDLNDLIEQKKKELLINDSETREGVKKKRVEKSKRGNKHEEQSR